MKHLTAVLVFLLPLAAGRLLASPPATAGISGDYIEARTCDVWTGPCFANSEINLMGDSAVLGWVVRSGSWEGVDLKDRSVAVALRSEGTLTTPTEGKVRAVVFVDDRSSPEQARALLAMARALGGKYLRDIAETRSARIAYSRKGEEALLSVGDRPSGADGASPTALAVVRTRALSHCCDSHCGNEAVAYPPLSRDARITPAKSVEHAYRGPGLGARWSDPMKRSAMVGEFSLDRAQLTINR